MSKQRPRKTLRRRLRRLLIGLAISAAVYTANAVYFSRTTSGIDRDYYAEVNARHAALSESQRAWPIYQDARNAWHEASQPIESMLSAYHAEQNQLETEDPLYDRPADPFISDENPFQIPLDHPLYPDALRALDAFQPHLALIHEAARRAACAFPATDDWTADPDDEIRTIPLPPTVDLRQRDLLLNLNLPQLGWMRHIAHILAFDSFAAADRQEGDTVVTNFDTALHIARQTHAEPTFMSQLVAIGNLHTAADTVTKIIDRRPAFLTDQQLEQLARLAWEAAASQPPIDFQDDLLAQYELMDRTYTKNAAGNGRIAYDGLRMMFSIDGRQPPHPIALAIYWPIRHRYADRKTQQSLIDDAFAAAAALNTAGPQGLPAFNQSLATIEQREIQDERVPWRTSILMPAFAKTAAVPHLIRTRLQATATRLGLERYKLAEGHYPDTLDQLVPTYLPELPADPFNPGHPIKYLLRDNQPILYSVGSNGVDNQATPAPRNADAANLEARFANPAGPSPTAPEADWILSQPQPQP